MYIVGICDDERKHRKCIHEMCIDFFEQLHQGYKIIEYESGEEVLDFIKGTTKQKDEREIHMHLLFLDIEMKGLSGIELLHNIEKSNVIWRVVFVTSHDELAIDTFGIKTLGFIKKPIESIQINKWLKVMIQENKRNELVEYFSGCKQGYILMENIYYCEADRNYTYLYTRDGKILINDNLKKWHRKVLSSSLVRIHRSFLINMVHVKSWTSELVTLENGAQIPIGRKYAKTSKEIYYTYIKGQVVSRM